MKTGRRDFLKTAAGLGAFGLPTIGSSFYQSVLGAQAPVKKAKKLGKAKSVIQIWMWGGPSQLETFDPKPGAGKAYCGAWDKPIKTSVPGLEFSQSIPLLASCADMFSVLRSVTHGDFGHETAAYKMQTGRTPGGNLVYPAIGAVVSLMKGYRAGYDSAIPPYIVLTNPLGRFSECGFLGTNYKPYATGSDPSRERFLASGFVLEGVDEDRQEKRLNLLDSVDLYGKIIDKNELAKSLETARIDAFGVLTGDEVKTFDLSLEKEETRKSYGMNKFGQSCLMARRLVEKGVPYVAINYEGGWDTHGKHFEHLTRKQPEMDQAVSFLFKDLRDRNLLDSTIVWWGGEFGRTPKMDYNSPWFGGRGHYGTCFCHMIGGGGLKSGLAIGESDKTAEHVAKRAIQPQDLLGLICMQLGFDPDAKMPNDKGFDVPTMAPASAEGYVTELI